MSYHHSGPKNHIFADFLTCKTHTRVSIVFIPSTRIKRAAAAPRKFPTNRVELGAQFLTATCLTALRAARVASVR
jgi:hypothetical protein